MNSPRQYSLFTIGGFSAALWWSVHFSENAQPLEGTQSTTTLRVQENKDCRKRLT